MSLSFELLRADDLLALQVEAVNLKLDAKQPQAPLLVRTVATKPAYLVFSFPPQSILEKAYFESAASSDPLDAAGSVPSRMAGNSRLVFRLPASVKQLAFNLSTLLDWSAFELVLSPTALGEATPPPIVQPTSLETALEIPYHVVLSPAEKVGWLQSLTAVTAAGRTELWHSRMARIVTVKSGKSATQQLIEASDTGPINVRAIWSPDFVDHGLLPDPGTQNPPFLAAMSPRNRAELVILTSGASGYVVTQQGGATAPWVPQPVAASRLFLSSLGGWLSARGQWPLQPNYLPTGGGTTQVVLMSEWDHIATQGRDHYVKIVTEGLLYPFGHRAALVTVTERKVVPPDGVVVLYATAYLKQHQYIIVREKVKTYDPTDYPHAGREMPLLHNLRIHTVVTPDIDQSTSTSFWITVGGVGFPFHLSGEDASGTTIDFLATLMFVSNSESNLSGVQSTYSTSGDQRLCPVKGQKMAFAQPESVHTQLRTTGLYFDTYLIPDVPFPFAQLPFVPILDQADVTIPVLEELQGSASPTTVQLYKGYLDSGLDPNAGVFATLETPQPVTFTAQSAGGFAQPNISVTALAVRNGLVAGNPDDAAAGKIKPTEFFTDLQAKLFGTVPLSALILVDSNGEADAQTNAPEIRIELKPNTKNPTTVSAKLSWSPTVTSYDNDPVHVDVNQGQNSALTLSTTLTRSLNSTQTEAVIHGELTNFVLLLFGVVGISFNSLSFSAKSGQKLQVKADLPSNPSPIAFGGALSFLQPLSEILPPGLLGSKGPSLDLLPDRIRVSYTLGLPPLGFGVFSLEGISIMAGVELPYLDGQPGFEFAFASRSSPFLLIVECLGGGGFVHLIIDASGVEMVEGALEFGAEVSLDLGVASGGVRIMAGIYFQLTGTSTTLTGFVDVFGEVSVLGIISISMDLNLSLTYQSAPKEVVIGKATLTVAVHVLFFSASVQISMEKSFGNTAGDPSIGHVVSLKNWQTYVAALDK